MNRLQLEAEIRCLHRESWGWALSCCGWDEADAEDALQTAYLRVLDGRAVYSGRSAFRTWLFGVIRRVAHEQRRRERRRAMLRRHLPAEPVVDDPVATVRLERSETSARLIRAMKSLPTRQREVLHLVFYEGMSVADAAQVMGITIGSARTHYARGKASLRAILETQRVHDETHP